MGVYPSETINGSLDHRKVTPTLAVGRTVLSSDPHYRANITCHLLEDSLTHIPYSKQGLQLTCLEFS